MRKNGIERERKNEHKVSTRTRRRVESLMVDRSTRSPARSFALPNAYKRDTPILTHNDARDTLLEAKDDATTGAGAVAVTTAANAIQRVLRVRPTRCFVLKIKTVRPARPTRCRVGGLVDELTILGRTVERAIG